MENNWQEEILHEVTPNQSDSTVGVNDASKASKKSHPLKPIIILALFSILSYPLLETVATLIDVGTGRDTTTNGEGWVPFHAISEPAIYLYVYGATAAVALSFIYLLIQTWKKSRSKLRVVLGFIGAIIVTCCAWAAFMISTMFIGGFIHSLLEK